MSTKDYDGPQTFVLTGPLAQHFRANGNAWNTLEDIAETTGLAISSVRRYLSRARGRNYLETDDGEGVTMYRIDPERLHALRDGLPLRGHDRTNELARAFCRKYRVKSPHEATERDPNAMREWCEMLGAA